MQETLKICKEEAIKTIDEQQKEFTFEKDKYDKLVKELKNLYEEEAKKNLFLLEKCQ